MGLATREAFGKKLQELAGTNENIVVLDADLSGSTHSGDMKSTAPERFFNMGIAEGNMVGVAAGLAASGKTVFAATFAMFATGRAWEQIRNSVAYPNLDVKICGSHAGIAVGEDGVSHQATEDIAIMRAIPNMEIYNPCDAVSTAQVVEHIAASGKPTYLRLGRAKVDDVYPEGTRFDVTKIHIARAGGTGIAIFATGLMVQACIKAAKVLYEEDGIDVTVVDVTCLKPLDEAGIAAVLDSHYMILTAEEHNVIGGLGSAVSDVSVKYCPKKIHKIGLQDKYAESGSFGELLHKYQLDEEGIINTIRQIRK
ncbi:MAG: transketolase family protein [Erysipelotrichaceae bacterium]|nr:transketolase family protein [Erysipelotrichaceae bacterium]